MTSIPIDQSRASRQDLRARMLIFRRGRLRLQEGRWNKSAKEFILDRSDVVIISTQLNLVKIGVRDYRSCVIVGSLER